MTGDAALDLPHAAQVPVLHTPRLVLRPLCGADAPALQRHANDEAVWRTLFEGFPHPYTRADAEDWCMRGSRAPAVGHVWGIVYEGAVIGCVGVRPDSGAAACNAETGYWIGQACWGHGIASEALDRVCAWAFEQTPQFTRLYAPIYDGNRASMRVAEKAGFHLEGRLPHSRIKAGRVIGCVLYGRYRDGLALPARAGAASVPEVPTFLPNTP